MTPLDSAGTPAHDTTDAAGGRGGRRAFRVALFIIVAVAIYAYGFEVTKVNLDELQSETRQEQLVTVLRELARPEILTFERVDTPTDAEFYMPCPAGGVTAAEARPDERHIVVDPPCAEPGEEITVTGFNFASNARGRLVLVPPAGDLQFTLDDFQADGDGNFSITVDTRERPEDAPQIIRAVTAENVGSIFNRVEVWQDDNENGIEDPVLMPESGTFSIDIATIDTENPGLALVAPGRNVVQFVSLGEAFQATSGPAIGDLAIPLEEDTTIGLRIESLVGDTLTLEGPAGTDLSGYTLSFYDGVTGQARSGDTITDSVVMSPRLSQAARDTWTRIIETVLLALLATSLGVLIAVPMSFLAARNLMRDISTPMIKLSLQIIALPIGIVVGFGAAGWAQSLSERLTGSTLLVLLGVVLIPVAIVTAVRWAVPSVEIEPPTPGERAVRFVVLAISGVAAIVLAFLIAELFIIFGDWLAPKLGALGFLGRFVTKLGDIVAAIIAIVTALSTAGLLMNLAGRLGSAIRQRIGAGVLKVINLPLAAVAGGLAVVLIARGVTTLYQITDPLKTTWVPLAVGAVAGLALAIRALDKESVGVGLSIYYVARTVFNIIRSIEPLIMVIVFVVWVGLGAFAGSLALALHTVAALAKLYSEQVESIMTGPIEAVTATGATRIQTIVYAVIPQIVPPYISFTMYRWDINVRMSTIIGFAGGGGIGFLLQQNIRLLDYQAASVNMLAIAVVVASMDYISSRIREKIV